MVFVMPEFSGVPAEPACSQPAWIFLASASPPPQPRRAARNPGLQDICMDKEAGMGFFLMSHFKDVARGSRSKHGNKCWVPFREPGLSICVRTAGKEGHRSLLWLHTPPTLLGPGWCLQEALKRGNSGGGGRLSQTPTDSPSSDRMAVFWNKDGLRADTHVLVTEHRLWL